MCHHIHVTWWGVLRDVCGRIPLIPGCRLAYWVPRLAVGFTADIYFSECSTRRWSVLFCTTSSHICSTLCLYSLKYVFTLVPIITKSGMIMMLLDFSQKIPEKNLLCIVKFNWDLQQLAAFKTIIIVKINWYKHWYKNE